MKTTKVNIIGKVIGYFCGCLLIFLAVFPFIWMVVSSFKTKAEVFAIPLQLLPEIWNPVNYIAIFGDKNFPMMTSLLATFSVAASAVVLSLTLCTMAAYAFARIQFKFKRLLFGICISTMFIPGIAILITSFLVVHAIGMLNTWWVLVLPGLVSGYNIFFFRQFYLNMPTGLEEAALIDGCSRFKIYTSIYIPLSVPPLVVLGAGAFIGYWNSYLWPAMTVPSNKELMQVIQVLRSYSTFYGNDYGAVLAGATVAAIPPIILFLIFQRKIVAGVVLSGLK